eukprot:CAMPEP_0198723104 /NCGR_PEP_ID=MMETSP1475-20131203/662_1 /TAXON_ID= ORGANISM="Unidentified sp., Strain CCMP1999" /NCGR_SAMPLE_ID=MMETSP1475 /ASSEMBLY_ACC=CAM_ASM_001111 /LENGTH=76 /DNA_ID=CAMNT_0044484111 /DNA_START=131 /DNA_END=359 /DNA_ORIENTATION=+
MALATIGALGAEVEAQQKQQKRLARRGTQRGRRHQRAEARRDGKQESGTRRIHVAQLQQGGDAHHELSSRTGRFPT